jgi:hypothetical protein
MPSGVSGLDSNGNLNLYLTNNVKGRAEYLFGSSKPMSSKKFYLHWYFLEVRQY